jgi:hypothetical protein
MGGDTDRSVWTAEKQAVFDRELSKFENVNERLLNLMRAEIVNDPGSEALAYPFFALASRP